MALIPRCVEARSGSPIRRAVIRDQPAGSRNGQIQPDRLDKRGDTFVVFRPQLPATSVHRSGLNPGRRGCKCKCKWRAQNRVGCLGCRDPAGFGRSDGFRI